MGVEVQRAYQLWRDQQINDEAICEHFGEDMARTFQVQLQLEAAPVSDESDLDSEDDFVQRRSEKVEDKAMHYLREKKFDYACLYELVELLPLRPTFKQELQVETITAGLWVRGPMQGITKDSLKYPQFVQYVNKFLRHHHHGAWTSFTLQKDVATDVHTDKHNLKGWPTTSVSFGDFSNGELWVALHDGENTGDKKLHFRTDPQGRELPGYLVDTKEKPYALDPFRQHATQPWSGTRWVLSAYPTRGVPHTPVHLQEQLRHLGFPRRGLPFPKEEDAGNVNVSAKPKKSTRRTLWKNAKRIAALTTWCATAATLETSQAFPLSHGADGVAIMELGDPIKTEEVARLEYQSVEPLFTEDLVKDKGKEAWNIMRTFRPATLWVHGDKLSSCLEQVMAMVEEQLRHGRRAVVEACHGASLWADGWLGSLAWDADKEENEEKIKRVFFNETPQIDPEYRINAEEIFYTYMDRNETEEVLVVDDYNNAPPLPEARGADAISFSEGPEIKPEVKSSLKRLHQNLGHPSVSDLARQLRLAGAGPEIISACKRMSCQVCQRQKRGGAPRPATLPTLVDFNQIVAVDGFSAYDITGKRWDFLSALDVGTSFSVTAVLNGRSAAAIEKTFVNMWTQVFGAPGTLALDLETGLQSGFLRFSEWHGTRIRPIAGQAHWQQGAVERHNRLWKEVWTRVVDQYSVAEGDIEFTVAAVNSALNTLRRQSGFSPSQAVWGRDPQVPEELVQAGRGEHFEEVITRDRARAREHLLRLGAKEAYFRCQADSKLRRSLLQRSRVAGPEVQVGEHVFIYRKPKSQKHWEWFGPAVAIGHEGPNLWCSLGGRCHLVAPEHIRRATGEEIGAAFSLRATQEDLHKLLEQDADGEGMYVGFEDGLTPDLISGDDGDPVLPEGDVREDLLPQEREDKDPAMDMEAPAVERGRIAPWPPHAPPVRKRHRTKAPPHGEGEPHGAYMVKPGKTPRGREKALEKELPWNLIPEEARGLFIEGEKTQYICRAY